VIHLDFLKNLPGLLGLHFIPSAAGTIPTRRYQIQTFQLAGFDHHDGEALWNYLTVGDSLQLRREPANPHDAHAIRVDWNGRKLGYVPRTENRATAKLMDQGKWLEARICRLQRRDNPWRRVEVEVWLAG